MMNRKDQIINISGSFTPAAERQALSSYALPADGAADICPEILTNLSEVALSWDCTEYKFEEHFLNSCARGGLTMLVDVTADSSCRVAQLENKLLDEESPGNPSSMPKNGPETMRSFFPNDLYDVYHCRMRSLVKFRALHRRVSARRIHHLQAHDLTTSFIADPIYDESENRNLNPGDSIFHNCLYSYPAVEIRKRELLLWVLHRVHDVFEAGTPQDDTGRPSLGACALTYREIAAGNHIPKSAPLSDAPIGGKPPTSVVNMSEDITTVCNKRIPIA